MEGASDFFGTQPRRPMLFYSLIWRQTGLSGRKQKTLTGYAGHMHKDVLVTINLPHVLLLKNKKNTSNKTGVNCWFIQEGNCKYPSHHKTAGTFFRHVCKNCDGTHFTKKLYSEK